MPIPSSIAARGWRSSLCAFLLLLPFSAYAQTPSAADYDSIQAAIDANPGRVVYLPAGDYPISKRLLIGGAGGGLCGPGKIIQTARNNRSLL